MQIQPPTCLGEKMAQNKDGYCSLRPKCIPWILVSLFEFPDGWGWRIEDVHTESPLVCHFENRRTTAQEAADDVTQWFRALGEKLVKEAT